jgi:hypothetical protein
VVVDRIVQTHSLPRLCLLIQEGGHWDTLFNTLLNMQNIDEAENEARMLRGELYHAFMPELAAKRKRCHHAAHRFNCAGEASRRKLVELWRE